MWTFLSPQCEIFQGYVFQSRTVLCSSGCAIQKEEKGKNRTEKTKETKKK